MTNVKELCHPLLQNCHCLLVRAIVLKEHQPVFLPGGGGGTCPPTKEEIDGGERHHAKNWGGKQDISKLCPPKAPDRPHLEPCPSWVLLLKYGVLAIGWRFGRQWAGIGNLG